MTIISFKKDSIEILMNKIVFIKTMYQIYLANYGQKWLFLWKNENKLNIINHLTHIRIENLNKF